MTAGKTPTRTRGTAWTPRVYDVAATLARTLVDEVKAPGKKRVVWEGQINHWNMIATGVYFYRMTAPGFSQTRKMVLLK